MKRVFSSEKLLIEDLTHVAEEAIRASKGLSIGFLIKMIRYQLRMPQQILAKRAGIPQSMLSRIEKGGGKTNLSTLYKILDALCCDLVIVPALRESIDMLRRKQARKQAEIHIRYLKGTMNLEDQQPDPRLLEELLIQEENHLLQGSGSELWEE